MIDIFNFLTKPKKTNIATKLFKIEEITMPILLLGAWFITKYKDKDYYNEYPKDGCYQMSYGIMILKSFYKIKNRYIDNTIEKIAFDERETINSIIENNKILKNFLEKGK